MEGSTSSNTETSAFISFIQEQFVSVDSGANLVTGNGLLHSSPTLQLLASGHSVNIEREPKAMLSSILNGLGCTTDPLMMEVKCGKGKGVRFVLKVAASLFGPVPVDAPMVIVGLGEPYNNTNHAHNSAVMKVLRLMEEDHHIKISDFSTRIVEGIQRNKTQLFVVEATSSLGFICAQLEKTLSICDSFAQGLNAKKNLEFVMGNLTQSGNVYAKAFGTLRGICVEFNGKLEVVKEKIKEIHNDLASQVTGLELPCGSLDNIGGSKQASISSNDVLHYALNFLGLPTATYENERGDDGSFIAHVNFFMPHMDMYKNGGNLKSSGVGPNCLEAEECAAFEALAFMQTNFRVKISDYNYIIREKIEEHEGNLLELLRKVIQISEEVKLHWGRLVNVIQCQGSLMHFDPKLLFSGPSSQGPIDAYTSSAALLQHVMKESGTCYESCSGHFDKLNRIGWHIVGLKRNVLY